MSIKQCNEAPRQNALCTLDPQPLTCRVGTLNHTSSLPNPNTITSKGVGSRERRRHLLWQTSGGRVCHH